MNSDLKSILFEEVWSGSKRIRIMESDLYMDKRQWVIKFVPAQSEQDEMLYRLAKIVKGYLRTNGSGDSKKYHQNMNDFMKDLEGFRKRYEEKIEWQI